MSGQREGGRETLNQRQGTRVLPEAKETWQRDSVGTGRDSVGSDRDSAGLDQHSL